MQDDRDFTLMSELVRRHLAAPKRSSTEMERLSECNPEALLAGLKL